jgi:Tfp pilus assembly protein PilN
MTALTSIINTLDDYSIGEKDSSAYAGSRRSSVWMIALMVIVIASIISSLSYTAAADREMSRQFDAKLGHYREAAERIDQARLIKNQGILLAAQAAFDASLIDAVPRSRALAEVSNAVSAGVRIEQISLAPAEPSSSTANLLQIKGVAVGESQLSSFVARLSKSQWMRAVVLRSGRMKVSDPKSPRNFELTATFDDQSVAAKVAMVPG